MMIQDEDCLFFKELIKRKLSSGTRLLGVDRDQDRVRYARERFKERSEIEIREGLGWDELKRSLWDAVVMIDVLHYFSDDELRQLFTLVRARLKDGGVFIFRDLDTEFGGVRSVINRTYERVAVGTGFTQGAQVNVKSRRVWSEFTKSQGFQVSSRPCTRFPFADVLFTAHKRSEK